MVGTCDDNLGGGKGGKSTDCGDQSGCGGYNKQQTISTEPVCIGGYDVDINSGGGNVGGCPCIGSVVLGAVASAMSPHLDRCQAYFLTRILQ